MDQRTFFGIPAHRVKVRDPLFGRKPKLTFYDRDGSRISLDKRTKARVERIDPQEIEARRGDWEGRDKLRNDARYAKKTNGQPVTKTIKPPNFKRDFVARDPNKQGDVTALHVFKDKVKKKRSPI